MRGLSIRPAHDKDLDAIVSNNLAMAHETEGKHLDKLVARNGAQAVLADPQKGFYLLAESSGRMLGQLQVTFEWSDWRNGNFWWIQSVFVHPEHRRQGVYSALHKHLIQMAKDRKGVCGIRLYTSKNNLTAQATYMSLGMQQSRYALYEEVFLQE